MSDLQSNSTNKSWIRKAITFIRSIYPSFEQVRIFFTPGASNFKKFLGGNQPNPPLLPKWLFYVLYPVALLIITCFYAGTLFLIALVYAAARNTPAPRYPSHKYKKVVKEGMIWDTTYYVERD